MSMSVLTFSQSTLAIFQTYSNNNIRVLFHGFISAADIRALNWDHSERLDRRNWGAHHLRLEQRCPVLPEHMARMTFPGKQIEFRREM
jgi:hypothetical protein